MKSDTQGGSSEVFGEAELETEQRGLGGSESQARVGTGGNSVCRFT